MAWIHFFNKTVSESILSPPQAFHHGACLVFLDAFQTDTTRHGHLHRSALDKLSQLLSQSDQKEDSSSSPVLMDNISQEVFGIHPFFISKGTVYRCIYCMYVHLIYAYVYCITWCVSEVILKN